ncbi:cell division ATP-binding protein FtsE [Inconstantimicrobium porci]|uniref:Cell division ATP-binding protein FtsE n=1 Tax=Inconstantimicrobium porci TaxID=2652291 RepID=A0A7X2SZT6_9CLOT|nr:cell division ATP-binding protein FtsE [Inconstantimicrobium porci]MDD6770256.1 cell division ATP-binding protein FtsE [Inconstantimicrobium porci]MSR89896.1 cell division ATP-binding protein FtsE [Inconstantimicrobium porci]
MIKFENVTKRYDKKYTALRNINLEINKGEFVFLVGLSGSGKSSLIKLMLREIKPSKGKVIVGKYDLVKMRERQVPYFRRQLGIVFQDFRLLEKKTVYENVAYAMRVLEHEDDFIAKRVPEVLRIVGLEKKTDCYPGELSGGEQQRVAIARAIINEPEILLCDEPTGNLDPITSQEIIDLLIDINNSGTTIVMATHDTNVVDSLKKRVISMYKGEITSDNRRGGYNIES